MCGVSGFWGFPPGGGEPGAIAAAMAERLHHRGPDDAGVWMDMESGVAIAHRRLAIVDLSAAGHQPMVSASGRWVLAYNGEIYNHLELRRILAVEGAAPAWRGHSDTETLLAAVEAWGVNEALKRSVGMFGLVLWDRRERVLWLARDRIGEKPMYYGWQGGIFLFGSEIKALRAHPAFDASVDRGALALLLRHNYVPGPYSIYSNIYKLPPGTWLRLEAGDQEASPVSYWSLAEVAERGESDPFTGSESEAIEELDRRLSSALRGQMMADVPLGALLSGGIDSSLVTALMQARSSRPVRTFTIGFEEKAYDEAAQARAVAMHLGTEHTEMRLSADEAIGTIPRLSDIYDEPFADSSQLPVHLVMRLARQHVKVALSGDAGDEFFGGYNRYVLGPAIWRKIGRVPDALRGAISKGLTSLPAATINRVAGPMAQLLGVALLGDKAYKLGLRLRDLRSVNDLYVALVTEWPDAVRIARANMVPPNLLDERERWPRLDNPAARMMALDAMTYLPDDILVKVDRASMSVSLETRAPFIDRDTMEFACRLPISMKLRDGRGKWILRQLLYRYVPRTLVDRPKMGFSIPLDEWLRGPLREWAEELLAENRLRREGYLDPVPIRAAWKQHVRGEGSFGYRLWSVLMFQAWLESSRGLSK